MNGKTPPTAHFIGDDGTQLIEFESVWKSLQNYYESAMPARVTISFFDNKGVSKFNPQRNQILLDRTGFQARGNNVIAHETSHLCLYQLTKGASNEEEFRFMDEGFAKIIENRFAGSIEQYKRQSLITAAIQLKNNNVSLQAVQKWSLYFGGPEAGRWWAYEVGASFDFFIIDQYGELKLKDLFKDIGKFHNLGISIRRVFNKSAADLESEWKAYLAKLNMGGLEGKPAAWSRTRGCFDKLSTNG